tara:strand:- start:239 stop:454 length:216 start_codon:yes stop_codon:yes gene_type:complete
MAKIININTGNEVEVHREIYHVCSICDSSFSESEGGVDRGYIGILPVSFCPTCLTGIMEMAKYFYDLDTEK